MLIQRWQCLHSPDWKTGPGTWSQTNRVLLIRLLEVRVACQLSETCTSAEIGRKVWHLSVRPPPKLTLMNRITGISSGKSHLLLVSSNGRVFSVASSAAFPEHGQMGIQGLTWKTRPPGPYDQCYEVPVATKIRKVAAGYYHSLLLDERGQVYAFGDNSSGQCGFDWAPDTEVIWRPTPIRIMPQESLSLDKAPVCRDISSGGNNSFFVVDAFKPNERIPTYEAVFACGRGLGGSLGNGKWSHYQGSPSKVKDLSGLFECRLSQSLVKMQKYLTE